MFRKEFRNSTSSDVDDLSIKTYEGFTKLSMNENLFGPSPKALSKLNDFKPEDLFLYPDFKDMELNQMIADANYINAENVQVGAGSEEFIFYLSRAVLSEGDEVVILKDTFQSYNMAFNQQGANIKYIEEKDKKFDIVNYDYSNAKMVVIVNPNMPTGQLFSYDELVAVHNKISKDSLLLIDFAYIEFSDMDIQKINNYIVNSDNILAIRTFSKMYGLAGLRAGYVYGNAKNINTIDKNTREFSVTKLAAPILKAVLSDKAYYADIKTKIVNNRTKIEEALKEANIDYYPSSSNFILINTDKEQKQKLYNSLVDNHKIIIRKYEKNTKLRITVFDDKTTDAIIKEIKSL